MLSSLRYEINPSKELIDCAERHLNTLPNASRLLRSIDLASDFCVVVAMDGEQLVGVATIKSLVQGKNGELGHLFVLPEYQRQGIAKELTRLRIEYAKANGLDLLYAVIKDHNEASASNLVQHGFVRYGWLYSLSNSGLKFAWYFMTLAEGLDAEVVMQTLTHPRRRCE
ncbi:histone acetyltransferase [Vibrio navarrensis]|uniref:GNAT family N-acetyltransferase n=1 Tax=Vibrio navarrensis TaxID=29495 RepID=UPI0018699B5E|nr:GNAT family N-acetyltransferase [Vibrio navarrensis]EJK2114663.1 GNAT family N-acetyltransferase [Vibrio navarrensis]MBE4577607.1 histone acetyltransferase [Vibrio navarrensis]MBE4585808.1 histone acetyltransferase [Vibrio navarrensis]MBE4587410.1 histone acetyltransferase [Vibrio navarrensis]MBE4596517.1 histone acetyltransferase [Vibrio navarrensis]